MAEHSTVVSATAVTSIPSTKYVNGETRYMKIQNPGRFSAGCKTLKVSSFTCTTERGETYPQKIRDMEKAKLAKLPAFSAVS